MAIPSQNHLPSSSQAMSASPHLAVDEPIPASSGSTTAVSTSVSETKQPSTKSTSSSSDAPHSSSSTNQVLPTGTPANIALTEQDAAKRTAEARTAFLASLQSVGSTADAGLQIRAADIAANSAALAKQQEQLDKSAAALTKESAKYQSLADDTRTKLKDIGDVQNFAEVIERELMVLEETLRIVEDGEEPAEDGVGEDTGEREGKVERKKKKWWF